MEIITIEQSPRTPLRVVGGIRYNEFGEMVLPPVKPEEPDTKDWKRMTPKRRAILRQYKEDREQYEKDMGDYLQCPTDDRTKKEVIIGLYEEMGKVLRNHGGIVLFDVFPKEEKPLRTYRMKRETQTEFIGHASNERRRYKRNRDLDKDTEYDTNIETGEKRQLTLFNCNTSDARKVPDLNILESFIEKPNTYLSRAYLGYILNGTPLTDWQKFQLKKRDSVRSWSIH